MTEPTRMLDDLELAAELRDQLRAYGSGSPSAEQRDRMFSSIQEELLVSPDWATHGASNTQWNGTGNVVLAAKLKFALAGLALIAGAVGIYALWPRQAPKPAAPSAPLIVAQATVGKAELETAVSSAEVELPPAPQLALPTLLLDEAVLNKRQDPKPRSKTRTRAARPLEQPVQDLQSASSTRADPVAELALLAQARRTLISQPAHALEYTEKHARDYPYGVFGEEREVLAIESLSRLGLTDEARRRAAAFEQSFPNSPQRVHLTRMMQSLGL